MRISQNITLVIYREHANVQIQTPNTDVLDLHKYNIDRKKNNKKNTWTLCLSCMILLFLMTAHCIKIIKKLCIYWNLGSN